MGSVPGAGPGVGRPADCGHVAHTLGTSVSPSVKWGRLAGSRGGTREPCEAPRKPAPQKCPHALPPQWPGRKGKVPLGRGAADPALSIQRRPRPFPHFITRGQKCSLDHTGGDCAQRGEEQSVEVPRCHPPGVGTLHAGLSPGAGLSGPLSMSPDAHLGRTPRPREAPASPRPHSWPRLRRGSWTPRIRWTGTSRWE